MTRRWAGLIAAILVAIPGTAAAADDDNAGMIIVTAQKRREPLSTVPIAVTVLEKDELQARTIRSAADLGGVVPGVIYTSSAYEAPVYTIRGVGFFNEALGATPTVSIYQNEVPLPFSAMAEGVALDAQQVEVLKGPQGALFGQNATGGTVNFIPAQPTGRPEGEIGEWFGRFDEVGIDGYLSGPLAPGLAARVAARVDRGNGFRRNDVSTYPDRVRTNGERNFEAARLLVDWSPGAGIALEFNLNGWRNRSDTAARQKTGYAPLTPLELGGYADSPGYPALQALLRDYPNAAADNRVAGFDPQVSLRRNDRFGQASLRADVDLTPSTRLTSLSAVSALGVRRPNDIDGTIYPDIFITVVGDITSFTQELRLAGTFGSESVRWMIGGNFERDVIHDRQNIAMNGTNSGIGPIRFQSLVNINDQRATTLAGFANIEARLADAVSIQAAIRYTGRHDRFNGCLADSGRAGGIGPAFAALSTALSGSETLIAPGDCVTLGADNKPVDRVLRSLDENNISFRTSISWRPGGDALVYGSITQGYKAGSFDTLPAIRPQQLDPVRQERVLAYEIGARGEWLDHRVQASVALFTYDYRGKQVAGYVDAGPPFGLLPALVSVPRSRVFGAESEIHWRGGAQAINLGIAWLDSRVCGDFVTAAPLGGRVDIGGESFPNAPRWQLSGDAVQYVTLNSRWRTYIGGDMIVAGRSKAAFGGEALFRLPAYALAGLRAGVETQDRRWRLELWVRNIFDQYYWTSVQHVEDTVTRLAGNPRTFGMSVRTRL